MARGKTLVAVVFSAAATVGVVADAETVLFDFETEAERKAAPTFSGRDYSVSVTNGLAASGRYALRLAGNGGWPSVTLRPPVTDWRGYDRLVVEVVSAADAVRGRVFGFLAGPDGDYRKGWDIRPMLSIRHRGYRQWVIPLGGKWPKSVSRGNVARIHFCTKATEFPDGLEICFDRIALLKKGEPLPAPSGPCWSREIAPMVAANAARLSETNAALSKRLARLESYRRFCSLANRSAFRSPDMAVGTVSSMERVLPRSSFDARAIPDGGLRVRLARDEYESVQIVVAPQGRDLAGIKVRVEGDMKPVQSSELGVVSDGGFAAANVECAAVGYVETKHLPPYGTGYSEKTDKAPGYVRRLRDPEVGWWPDPILGFLDGVPVRGMDVQSFWVRVHCPPDQRAGEYAGALVVSADGVEPVRIPLRVRVNGFSVGRKSALPLAIAFGPAVSDASVYTKRHKDPLAPVNIWRRHREEWTDFLADYKIPLNHLYHCGGVDFAELERLKAKGELGMFNLGFWNPPNSTNAADMAAWRKRTLPHLRRTYAEAKKRGLLDKSYVYGCDEISSDKFPAIKLALAELKAEQPGVPFLTTAYDVDYGVGSPLEAFDWFTPKTSSYDVKKAARSRAAGHQVWWYICVSPRPPYANMFIECSGVEERVLMGAQAVKYRPDGFLYYQVSVWNAPRCVETGPFTEFAPPAYQGNHGDGTWTYVGPDGIPLPTLRLENFRDGLEDYAYAKLLEQKLGEVENGKLTMKNVDGAVWRGRAHKLLDVPRKVVDTMTNYTDNPAVLYRWRDAMADLIEAAK